MPQHHTIARIRLELRTGQLGDLWSVQEEVSRLLWQQATPAMEALFDELVGGEEVIRLDQVEIELQPLDTRLLAEDFIPALVTALRQSLQDHLAGYHPISAAAIQEKRDRPTADWEIWLYFLRYGRLPWWGQSESWEYWLSRWQTALQSNTGWHPAFRALLVSSPAAQERLILQFSEGFRHQLILLLQPTWLGWRSLLAQSQQLLEEFCPTPKAIETLNYFAWSFLFELLSHAQFTDPLPARIWVLEWLAQFLRLGLDERSAWFLEGTPSARTYVADVESQTDSAYQTTALQQSFTSSKVPPDDVPDAIAVERRKVAEWCSRITSVMNRIIARDQALWLAALQQIVDAQLLLFIDADSEVSLAATTHQDSRSLSRSRSKATPQTHEEDLAGRDLASIEPVITAQAVSSSNPVIAPEEETMGIYLNQAGLVLLHPFLKIYFEDAGLLDGEQFRDLRSQQIAVYLLHYLATRQTDPPEYELVLSKVLCGYPLNEAIAHPELPTAALAEAEHLLQTVIDYWQALKSTSPDGLREGFLQRQGKLTRTGEMTWKLQVEPRSLDILLSRLPWGISMVKLPWMDYLLSVEWT